MIHLVHGKRESIIKGILSAYDNEVFLWHDATGNWMSVLVGWLFGFYGISTLVGYLMPNPFLYE